MTKRELETCPVQCPYCWESFAVVVDCSVPSQRYIEDCEVCCRPITLIIHVDENGEALVEARHEDDAG